VNVPFQRVSGLSNTQIGSAFEEVARACLAEEGISVRRGFAVPVGVGELKKSRSFDLGSDDPPVLVECKSHRWTAGKNAPSAKLTVWNEAMYYFTLAPRTFRRIFFALRDYSPERRLTLAEHYLHRFAHLAPPDVEF
jgi:hypothetical protein